MAIAESPERFESLFCTAQELRAGVAIGVTADIPDDEGGVILSLSRADRWHAVELRRETARALFTVASRSLLAWCLLWV